VNGAGGQVGRALRTEIPEARDPAIAAFAIAGCILLILRDRRLALLAWGRRVWTTAVAMWGQVTPVQDQPVEHKGTGRDESSNPVCPGRPRPGA
jgi:hypothetical protein